MSVELIGVLVAVLAIGATLAGLILTSTRGLRQDMTGMEFRLYARIGALDSRLDARIDGLESWFDAMEKQFGALRERMAHLEGLLEGLRESITGRVKAS